MTLAERLKGEPSLGPLVNGINKWASDILTSYFERFPRNPYELPKDINDAVCRTVSLEPWELYILDSPLLQRLRYIRQLGVAHFLFPSAGYSRFEHTIGALHRASTLCESLHRHSPDLVGGADRQAEIRLLVRLAALMHDAGHCVFSHVSEKLYGAFPAVQQLVEVLHDYYVDPRPAPSEALAIVIVQTPAFADLLNRSNRRLINDNDDIFIENICACIAGSLTCMRPDSYAAEIINGKVDCDKLDYLARDAYMTGTPVALDVNRLMAKLRIADLKDEEGAFLALGIAPSGARALEELLVARIFLYDKLYYHPKVMAAEELLRQALRLLTEAHDGFADPAILLQFGDDELLSLNPQELSKRVKLEQVEPKLVEACKLFEAARLRHLPKRALAFATRFLHKQPPLIDRFQYRLGAPATADLPPEPTPPGAFELRELLRELTQDAARRDLAVTIKALATELGARSEVFVGVSSVEGIVRAVDLPAVLPDGTVLTRPSFFFEASKWSEAFKLNKQTSYIFAYEDIAKVHLAAERVFAERGMKFGSDSWIVAKVLDGQLKEERERLNGQWYRYRLPADFLDRQRSSTRIQELVDRFSSFLRSFDPEFGPMLVRSWLSQFPDADLQDSALGFLEHVTFVERSVVVDGFKDLVAAKRTLKEALWIPLRPRRGPGKSADGVSYVLKEVMQKYGLVVEHVDSVTANSIKDCGQVVFFDDSLNTGVQCCCLIGSWMGVTEGCVSEDDRDEDGALAEDVISALKSTPVSFCFYAAHKDGRRAVQNFCESASLQFASVEQVVDTTSEKHSLGGFTCDSAESRERFVGFLTDTGERLLTGKGQAGWTASQICDNALGYGGLQLTLVFSHSVSSAVPPALWKPSFEPAFPWLPAFPRKLHSLRERLKVHN